MKQKAPLILVCTRMANYQKGELAAAPEAVLRTELGATLGRSGLFATVEIAVDQCSAQLAAK